MINDPIYNELRELSWRRPLTADEKARLRAFLTAHPEAQADWEAEGGLNEALSRLPDAPVASNFTARVLQAVERESLAEERRAPQSRGFWPWRLHWLPRLAFVAVALGTALISREQIVSTRRARVGQSVTIVADVSSLPSPEILKDFDAINALSETPAPDMALLAALK